MPNPLNWKLNTVVQFVTRDIVNEYFIGKQFGKHSRYAPYYNYGIVEMPPVDTRLISVFDSQGIAEDYSAFVEACWYRVAKRKSVVTLEDVFAEAAQVILTRHNYDKEIAIVLLILKVLIVDLPVVDRGPCGPIIKLHRYLELRLEKGE